MTSNVTFKTTKYMCANVFAERANSVQPLAGQPFPVSAHELGTHSAISDGHEIITVSKFCLACGKEIGPNDQHICVKNLQVTCTEYGVFFFWKG